MLQWPYVERRACPRGDLRVKIGIDLPSSFTDDPAVHLSRCAFARNICAGGIQVLSSIPIHIGVRLTSKIPVYIFNEMLELPVEVTRCEEYGEGYLIAMFFLACGEKEKSLIGNYITRNRNTV